MVRGLVRASDPIGFLLSVRRWTVPVYYADPGTRRYDVRLTAEWAPRKVLRRVPIPRDAQPDPEDDGHLVIVDRASGCEYDFWQARRTRDGRWEASWGNRISLRGAGVYRDGWSARASGFGLLAGLIFPEELAGGKIEHALVFSHPYTREGDPVPPATKSDGWSEAREAIPEGALLQLDPALDLDELELEPYERVIAEALQRYGMYLADTGGNVSLYAAHPQPYDGDPYADLLPGDDYIVLDGIPLDRFRVLKPRR